MYAMSRRKHREEKTIHMEKKVETHHACVLEEEGEKQKEVRIQQREEEANIDGNRRGGDLPCSESSPFRAAASWPQITRV